MALFWEISFTGSPSEADLEHIAGLIQDGFTSGYVPEHDAAPEPGSWRSRGSEPIPDGALPDNPGDYPIHATCTGCGESIWVYAHDETWSHRS